MTITAKIHKTGNNSYEISAESTIANFYFFGMGKTLTEAKDDFMASVYDMQHFVAVTNHPLRNAASKVRVEFC